MFLFFKSVNVCVNIILFDVYVYYYDEIFVIKVGRKDLVRIYKVI